MSVGRASERGADTLNPSARIRYVAEVGLLQFSEAGMMEAQMVRSLGPEGWSPLGLCSDRCRGVASLVLLQLGIFTIFSLCFLCKRESPTAHICARPSSANDSCTRVLSKTRFTSFRLCAGLRGNQLLSFHVSLGSTDTTLYSVDFE